MINKFEMARSDQGDGGWSLHPAGYTDEQYAGGSVPLLVSGPAEWIPESREWNRPNAADYEAAEAALKKWEAL